MVNEFVRPLSLHTHTHAFNFKKFVDASDEGQTLGPGNCRKLNPCVEAAATSTF